MNKLLLLFIPFLFIACETQSVSGTVEYEVTCYPEPFDITYENASGNTEQKTIRSKNWETSFPGQQGDFVYISAQAQSRGSFVTVRIIYKGEVIEEASSDGDFVIATASGSLP